MTRAKGLLSVLFLGLSIMTPVKPAQAQSYYEYHYEYGPGGYRSEQREYRHGYHQPVRRPRYYTREDVRVCRDQGRKTATGALIGGALGALLGDSAEAAVGGALVGGLLGYGLSCERETRYIMTVDEHLSRRDYWRPHRTRDTRVVVVRSGYSRRNEVCRTYRSEIYTNHGWVTETSTACRVNGMWRHGYEEDVIWEEDYRHQAPPRPPAYDYGDDYGYEEDYDQRNDRSDQYRDNNRRSNERRRVTN